MKTLFLDSLMRFDAVAHALEVLVSDAGDHEQRLLRKRCEQRESQGDPRSGCAHRERGVDSDAPGF